MATSRILGPDGQPITMPDLQEPQTSRLLHLQRELQSHPTRGLTPSRLARILDAAENGDLTAQYELFEDMEEKDGHIAAEPDIIADGDRACTFRPRGTYGRINRMIRRVQAHARSEKNAVADGDACHIKENAIHIGIEILADERVASIIAIERWLYESAFSKGTEQFVKQLVTFLERVVLGCVDGLHQATFAHIRVMLLWTIGHIQFTGEHALPLICR